MSFSAILFFIGVNVDWNLQDPTSITIVWALYELARHPQILEQLRKDIASR